VNAAGKTSLAGFSYAVGATYAGEPVEVVVAGGLVDILHAGVVVATHAQRLQHDQADRAPRARVPRRARDATIGLTVTRLANNTGMITFADKTYAAGRRWAHASIDVTIVAGSVQLSKDGKVIRIPPHPPRPLEGTRRLRQPQRTAPPQELRHRQRRLTDHVVQVPELICRPGTGT
jgi:Mu transposase, C-terminal domain